MSTPRVSVLGVLYFAVASTVILGGDPPKTALERKAPAKEPALSRVVDLRPRLTKWGLGPRSQGSRNTCSVFVAAGALEFALSTHFNRGVPVSVEYLNWACNNVINNRTEDRGQFFHDLLKGFAEHGACLEADMPYRARFEAQLKPSEQALARAKEVKAIDLQVHWINPWKPEAGLTHEQVVAIKKVLAKGYPVAAGSSHSRLLVGYQDDARQPGGGLFLTRDSGAGDYAVVTYEFAKEKVGDVFWVEPPPKPPAKKRPVERTK